MSKSFNGKTVLITGASSGIGAGTAIEFAKLGANLVLGGRNEKQLQETKEACIKEGLQEKQVCLVSGDVINEAVLASLIESCIKSFDRLDVLVNNAGLGSDSAITELTMADYDKTVNVNLRAVVELTLKALPHLIKSKGNVVNISSIASWRPIMLSLPYCVSKAGLDMFTKCLAFELAPQGVRVNSVNPGCVPTNIGRDNKLKAEDTDEFIKNLTSLHPIGRWGEVKEIADSIIFLASENASFVTGQCLGVCGGMSLGGVKF